MPSAEVVELCDEDWRTGVPHLKQDVETGKNGYASFLHNFILPALFFGIARSMVYAGKDLILCSGKNCESLIKILTLSFSRGLREFGNSTKGVGPIEPGVR